MLEKQLEKFNKLAPLVKATGNDAILTKAKFLYDRITHPESYLVFLGETSSGKSSMINGLFGEHILPVKVCPNTASIVEVSIDPSVQEDEFYAINKDATIDTIDQSLFTRLCENPDNNLERLRYITNKNSYNLSNVRIFDTPGYGSIVKEHEEVLEEFLPNSDIVVYTVLYKVGIQQVDFDFLRILKELIRDDVQIILLINRCPVSATSKDHRIQEILNHAKDILKAEPDLFMVKAEESSDGQQPLPSSPELWEHISKLMQSPQRTTSLESAFDSYIEDLYSSCDSFVRKQYSAALMSEEELQDVLAMEKETANKIRESVNLFIEPTFEQLINGISGQFDMAEKRIHNSICLNIDESKKTKKDEIVAYTNGHLVPHTIKAETQEIQDHIETVILDLNKKVGDYIQKELIEFNNKVSIRLQTNQDVAIRNLGLVFCKELAQDGLSRYFLLYGGAGGANAGIANAASHMLKKIGDLFGKTFSRETHNQLKHVLAKIGATSAKAMAMAVAVILEGLFIVVDLATWKRKLKGKVKEGLEEWKKNTISAVEKDLNKLKDTNIETVNQIADEMDNALEFEKSTDIEQLKNNIELSDKTRELIFNN